jgi:hypothetical protein
VTPLKDRTQVFVVRLWVERREVQSAPPEWRGMIEQLPGMKRRYFRDLDQIKAYLAQALVEMGVNTSQGKDSG